MSTSKPPSNKITIPLLQKMKESGNKITMLTAYDATFASLLDSAGVETILVGDSLGMVIQGEDNTIPVTIDEMVYHTRCVVRKTRRAHVIGDMPFMSYQTSISDAISNAGRLMKEGGAHSVKLEGGMAQVPTIKAMVDAGVPVMAHLGLRPQTVHQMGGYKIQGKTKEGRQQLLEEALMVEKAGAYAIVLEGVIAEVAAEITSAVSIPTIGISSGPDCDGQVLVIYDLLGMNTDFAPKFVKKYADMSSFIQKAANAYITDVKESNFPAEEHTFRLVANEEK
jgi:3-methyl-2-oxobutanoate hydroxymethyltransferase